MSVLQALICESTVTIHETEGQEGITFSCRKRGDHTGDHHGTIWVNGESIDTWWTQR